MGAADIFVLIGGLQVLYVYEIQVASSYQRQGIGGELMQLVEAIALHLGMDIVSRHGHAERYRVHLSGHAHLPEEPSTRSSILQD